MRVWAISDIHIDYEENERWIGALSAIAFKDDALILAGDVCHHFPRLQECLLLLKGKFAVMFFVPGNHDLWVNENGWLDSISKWQAIQNFCLENGIWMTPQKLSAGNPVWIVPLLSWYTQPHEGMDSLYIEKPGEDESNRMWSDNYFIKWQNSGAPFKASVYFSQLNEEAIGIGYDAPVISFSHFLPRREMMFSENRQLDLERMKKFDRSPQFNFSRVAGSALIEQQIRRIGSRIHVYGHQHINRDRAIDGVRYLSHCLGYPDERSRGTIHGIEQGLKLIWDTEEKVGSKK